MHWGYGRNWPPKNSHLLDGPEVGYSITQEKRFSGLPFSESRVLLYSPIKHVGDSISGVPNVDTERFLRLSS
jgi:hypothetical protein